MQVIMELEQYYFKKAKKSLIHINVVMEMEQIWTAYKYYFIVCHLRDRIQLKSVAPENGSSFSWQM